MRNLKEKQLIWRTLSLDYWQTAHAIGSRIGSQTKTVANFFKPLTKLGLVAKKKVKDERHAAQGNRAKFAYRKDVDVSFDKVLERLGRT